MYSDWHDDFPVADKSSDEHESSYPPPVRMGMLYSKSDPVPDSGSDQWLDPETDSGSGPKLDP